LDYFTTNLFGFVCEYINEARPASGNRSGKSAVPDHPSDVQAFHGNLASSEKLDQWKLCAGARCEGLQRARVNSGDPPLGPPFFLRESERLC
jgi:hypothetical protein